MTCVTVRYRYFTIWVAICLASLEVVAQKDKQLVRLAIIEVDSVQLDRYNEFLQEEIVASIEKEPGVITLFAVAERAHPEFITLFETYADSSRYRKHLATPHFERYKQGTLQMVKHLELVETTPIFYHRKHELSEADSEDFFIRLIKIKIDSGAIDDFARLARTVMLPGLKKEPGVLVMYAVAEKNDPTHVDVLEVYADSLAYQMHIKTQHFLAYKKESGKMIRSLTLTDVKPILLGSKPQN
jgi:quinol monooxygenase YgiN